MNWKTKSTLFTMIEGDHFHDFSTYECESTAVVESMGDRVERIVSGT